jgi:hypothetical protein
MLACGASGGAARWAKGEAKAGARGRSTTGKVVLPLAGLGGLSAAAAAPVAAAAPKRRRRRLGRGVAFEKEAVDEEDDGALYGGLE